MDKISFYDVFIIMATCVLSCISSKNVVYETPCNLIEDGSFEKQQFGTIQKPFNIRPMDAESHFIIQENSKKSHGNKVLHIKSMAGDWWGISQKIQLIPGKKYTTSFLVRGDTTEMHCGAVSSGVFYGWNNVVVPNTDWQRVSYDFYVRENSDGKTNIYIYFRHPTKNVDIEIDELKVLQELPDKI